MKFYAIHLKYTRKWSKQVLLSANLVTPHQDQGHRKWYKMVKVNGALKHGRYERIWLKILRIMSKLKFLQHKTDSPTTAGQTNTTDNTDSYVTQIDQKQTKWNTEVREKEKKKTKQEVIKQNETVSDSAGGGVGVGGGENKNRQICQNGGVRGKREMYKMV